MDNGEAGQAREAAVVDPNILLFTLSCQALHPANQYAVESCILCECHTNLIWSSWYKLPSGLDSELGHQIVRFGILPGWNALVPPLDPHIFKYKRPSFYVSLGGLTLPYRRPGYANDPINFPLSYFISRF
jgi:hypothetical protein